ncbi:hypothetical protein [Streptomyces uncialis]|uniref:hypothetical protein n=1 Tax=Streptomyces uncialis TaxID=1048205 RepID=UPI00386F6916|nr:hypothetical protein OG268_16860 [Streptomyces uncialis]
MSSRADFASAADELATRVLSALRGAGGTAFVSRHFDTASDSVAALAAIRVIGADTFTPHVLTGAPFHTDDAATVARSLAAFPAPDPTAQAPTARTEQRTLAWRDWATAECLARFSGGSTPATTAPPQGDDELADTTDWRRWSVRMAQLATLAIPGLDGPVHEAARAAALPLARGATRSVLRRDHRTAVCLIRWLAWLHHEGVALPVDPAPMAEHVRLLGGVGPRTAVDLAIARHLLDGRLPQEPEAVRT